ncbi:hydrolase domain protein [Caudoviricetes sp.]|nr:hydrolase domain protein [Caudoviricetes sp.]
MANRKQILGEIETERERQALLWGDQSHLPEVNDFALIGIDTEEKVKREYRLASQSGEVSFALILREEFVEALRAETPETRREELVQVAAFCLQWIERIDDDSCKKKSK